MSPPRRPSRSRAAPPTPPAPLPPDDGIPFGDSGLHPRIGLGLWALGRWERDDEERTRAVVDRALTLGIRWFDTAEVYGSGRSERILGDALAAAGASARSAFVGTKVSWEHLRPPSVRAALTGSLHRLGRSYVDLYLVHAPDPHTPIPETMGALEELWVEGKARALGVSNFALEELDAARESLRRARVAVNQVQYNLFDRAEAEPILDYCRHHGIVVEAYSPLARGLLAGRYLDGELPGSAGRRDAPPLFAKDRLPRVVRSARAIRTLAADAGVSLTAVALHWLARRGVVPVFGASRPEQVDAVVRAWATRPPDELLDRADALAREAA